MKPFLRFRGSGFFILHHLLLDATIRAGGPLPAPSSGALFPQEECYLCCTEDLPTAFIALPALNHTPNGSPEVRAPLFIVFIFFFNPFNGRVAHTRAAGLSSASCSGRAARDVLQGPPPGPVTCQKSRGKRPLVRSPSGKELLRGGWRAWQVPRTLLRAPGSGREGSLDASSVHK